MHRIKIGFGAFKWPSDTNIISQDPMMTLYYPDELNDHILKHNVTVINYYISLGLGMILKRDTSHHDN